MPRHWPEQTPGSSKRRSRRLRKKLKLQEFKELGFMYRAVMREGASGDEQVDLTERMRISGATEQAIQRDLSNLFGNVCTADVAAELTDGSRLQAVGRPSLVVRCFRHIPDLRAPRRPVVQQAPLSLSATRHIKWTL